MFAARSPQLPKLIRWQAAARGSRRVARRPPRLPTALTADRSAPEVGSGTYNAPTTPLNTGMPSENLRTAGAFKDSPAKTTANKFGSGRGFGSSTSRFDPPRAPPPPRKPKLEVTSTKLDERPRTASSSTRRPIERGPATATGLRPSRPRSAAAAAPAAAAPAAAPDAAEENRTPNSGVPLVVRGAAAAAAAKAAAPAAAPAAAAAPARPRSAPAAAAANLAVFGTAALASDAPCTLPSESVSGIRSGVLSSLAGLWCMHGWRDGWRAGVLRAAT